MLLHNKDIWCDTHGPILVVCYTNHALDQFLEGIHEFHPEGIIRVGGRSSSEKMMKCNLREIKLKMRKEKKIPERIKRAYRSAYEKVRTRLG